MFETGNIHIARLFGIPVLINFSWLLSLGFITAVLAMGFYPEVLSGSKLIRDERLFYWMLSIGSILLFVLSILLHELAHSLIAHKHGMSVKSITLFMFGGISKITGEARCPRHEFWIAIAGPLTSGALGGLFFVLWWLTGFSQTTPAGVISRWLAWMNVALAVFNMAPAFPLDGGRLLRSALWGVSGNFLHATRITAVAGRILGCSLILIGGFAFLGLLPEPLGPWSGTWFAVLGFYLNSSGQHGWFRAKATVVLSRYKAAHIMKADLATATRKAPIQELVQGAGPTFIYFVMEDDRVVGVVTEKETAALGAVLRLTATVSDVMTPCEKTAVAALGDDGASLLQRMEEAEVSNLPILSEGRVIGVVSKEYLMAIVQRT